MKILIAEDDMISRKVMFKVLSEFGECDIVVNGMEAVDAYLLALKDNEPYDLICLDIMMPKIDGIRVLKTIRQLEVDSKDHKKVKIIMTTALTEHEVVEEAFNKGCDAYAPKPIDIDKLIDVIRKFELIT